MSRGGARSVVTWHDRNLGVRTMPVGPECRDAGVERALPSRRPANYQQRRNYEGFYWCAGSQSHVWYESMTEYTSLMYLDHTEAPSAVAAQPMWIDFADGSRHCPDYLAVLGSGRRVVYDVKPLEMVDEAALIQFASTAAICEEIGWGYEVLHGLPRVSRHNLEWLAGYRHPWNAPGPSDREHLRGLLREPCTLREAVAYLDSLTSARAVPAVYHMIWTREIECDLASPLDWSTTVRTCDE